ncbi:MAG: gamma-glutamyltransferase family protein [Dehalococcoidia bacterium]|nr:MAG: gamma-glutamyltransferase family protein [Dehalococcoidia bacterium]
MMKKLNLDWNLSYPSTRKPMLGANVVATSQPLAAQAGMRMLLSGGNAIDAAVAAAIALTVVEPTMNGIGGDAFAIVWDGNNLHGLNASGRSPSAWRFDMFSGLDEMPAMGWQSVTVPGAVSSWVELSKTFGNLRFGDLFLPAIEYAKNGFPVSPFVSATWAQVAEKYRDSESFVKTFLPGGRAPSTGEWFRNTDQVETLVDIAESFGESFYKGRLAELIAGWAGQTGGLLTKDDLAAHRAEWVKPLSIDYGDYTLHELPPANQGLAALLALGILKHTPISEMHPDSADSLQLQIEVMDRAISIVRAEVADSAHMRVSAESLLEDARLRELALTLGMGKGSRSDSSAKRREGDTVYLTVADAQGMMVSLIQSNYFDFGSGIVIPDTGISLHSRAACFSLEEGHPNAVGGGKRPFHTLCPGFVTSQGAPVMSFGVMGGAMQPQGHVQTFLRVCDYGQNPQAACDAPRWYVGSDGAVALERGRSDSVVTALRERGRIVDVLDYGDPLFGGAQTILALEKGYCAASDPRKDGQAIVS